jgi:hypothetical protein
MTVPELEELLEWMSPASASRVNPHLMRGLEAVNAKRPELLIEVWEAMTSNEGTVPSFKFLLETISGSTQKEKAENLLIGGPWLNLHVAALPLISRFKFLEPSLVDLAVSSIAINALQRLEIAEPTGNQMKSATVCTIIAYDTEKKPTLADIDYIAANLDEVEPLIPELKKRKSFDRETIEMILDFKVTALREGEL